MSSVTFLLSSFQDNGVYRNPTSRNKLADNYQMVIIKIFSMNYKVINNMYKRSEQLTEPTGIWIQDPSFSFLTAALPPRLRDHIAPVILSVSSIVYQH